MPKNCSESGTNSSFVKFVKVSEQKISEHIRSGRTISEHIRSEHIRKIETLPPVGSLQRVVRDFEMYCQNHPDYKGRTVDKSF